jgi:hypothetical protein
MNDKRKIKRYSKYIGGEPPIDVKKLYKRRYEIGRQIYLRTTKLQPCIQEGAFSGNLALVDNENKEVINFEKQIGSQSAYGEAYLVTAFEQIPKPPLQISIKIMNNNRRHRLECELLRKMSLLMINQYTPNLPAAYVFLECKGEHKEIQSSKQSKVKPSTLMKNKNYFVVLNELANGGDVENFFTQAREEITYTSVIFQMIFGIQAFHQLGYSHNDAHLGNFLCHAGITQGGYWQYQYKDTIICVPNTGYLMVLWDPGLAEPLTKNTQNEDFERVISLIYTMKDDEYYEAKGLIPIYESTRIYDLLYKFTSWLSSVRYASFMDYLIDIIKRGEINSKEHFILTNKDLPNISTFPAPYNYIINEKPYPLEFTYTE